jgi:hypothetical protein
MLALMRPALVALPHLLAVCANASAHSHDPPAAPKTASGEVDYTCKVEADCAVKDVGNCCGRYPACVNRESPTFPDRVKAECAKKGEMGICGFPEITGCACVEGRCASRANDGGSVIR